MEDSDQYTPTTKEIADGLQVLYEKSNDIIEILDVMISWDEDTLKEQSKKPLVCIKNSCLTNLVKNLSVISGTIVNMIGYCETDASIQSDIIRDPAPLDQ